VRPRAVDAARALVRERFPDAVQAWLAGSTVTGRATDTSDLDITVLLDEVEVHRESVLQAGWPVELFVHTPASIEHYVARDLERRHPTMARLVASGVPLLGDGGAAVLRHCADVLERGPGPVAAEDLELMRYGLTDLLDDLAGAPAGTEATAVAIAVWQATAELALALAETWHGTGKWLVREMHTLDAKQGTRLAASLDEALRLALLGDREPLSAVADGVLDGCGGRYWVGLYRAAELP
jgi:hypothetical protein